MVLNLGILGLSFDIIGVLIITITEIINPFQGMIPPKYKLEFFGLLLILTGFTLQIFFYLSN